MICISLATFGLKKLLKFQFSFFSHQWLWLGIQSIKTDQDYLMYKQFMMGLEKNGEGHSCSKDSTVQYC
jgi:hypothetical protein